MLHRIESSKVTPDYATATGPIGFTLKSDLLFHVVMQQSEKALIGLVCALKGIDQNNVSKIEIMNPIDINQTMKETIMDIKLTLNDKEVINIELQTYFDKYWKSRSLLYLCRGYDCLKEGEDYSHLKPTTHFCITDQDLFPGNNAFTSRYYLMEETTHEIYSKNISIGVVQLQYTDNATNTDKESNLVFWANLFNAQTWEEFRTLASGNPAIEEVGKLMLILNVDDQQREALEAQRRYREQYASQYTAGYTDAEDALRPVISDLSEQNSSLSKQVSDLNKQNTNLNSIIQKYRDKYGDL